MSLVAAGNTQTLPSAPIINNSFWPDIDPARFRDAHRIGTTITAVRVIDALTHAMAETNRLLRHWQQTQRDQGHAKAGAVPLEEWQLPGTFETQYCRAVFSLAHANLIERYRDYDTTNSGDKRADQLTDPADDYRRDAAWAISTIEGRPHSTVELI